MRGAAPRLPVPTCSPTTHLPQNDRSFDIATHKALDLVTTRSDTVVYTRHPDDGLEKYPETHGPTSRASAMSLCNRAPERM